MLSHLNHQYTHRIHGTGIFTYIYHKNQPNVGKYTIHGWYGIWGKNTQPFGCREHLWKFRMKVEVDQLMMFNLFATNKQGISHMFHGISTYIYHKKIHHSCSYINIPVPWILWVYVTLKHHRKRRFSLSKWPERSQNLPPKKTLRNLRRINLYPRWTNIESLKWSEFIEFSDGE